MLRRLSQVLLAFIVALAMVLPVSVRAMPMPAGMSGTAIQQHCTNCPRPARTGTNPDKMMACQVLACTAAVATLPSPALLPGRVLLRAAYLMASPVRWTAAARAPDPFPPRPIALV
jgi:hypothetical protein